MIHLTRLNGQPLIINSDMIKLIENAPDTVISLANGEKFVVRESGEEVLERIVEFRRRVLEGVGLNFPGWASSKTEAAGSKRRESESDER
jgi:flagellar protein FlbD